MSGSGRSFGFVGLQHDVAFFVIGTLLHQCILDCSLVDAEEMAGNGRYFSLLVQQRP